MEELKEETKKWTLASDAKLFSYLQKLSSDMNSKTKTFVSKVEDLTFDVAESEVSLRNTFNEFLMLGNTQFIENRVYDDDDDDGEDGEGEKKSTEEMNQDPMAILKEAFAAGQEAFHYFYFDESPDDRFEDIYNTRPLPYIIGTRNFNESVDGGLGAVVVDMSEEGEEQEDNAHEENRSGSGGDYNEDHNYNGYEDTYDEEKSVAASERDQSKYEASYDDDMSYTAPPPSGDAVRNMLNAQLSGGRIPAGPPPRGEQGFSIRDVDEGEEEEDDDIFTTQDDPYSLFGKPPGRESLIAKSAAKTSIADLFGDLSGEVRDRSDSNASDNSLFAGSEKSTAEVKRKASFSNLFRGGDDDTLFDVVSQAPKAQTPPLPDKKDEDDEERPSFDISKKESKNKKGVRAMDTSSLFGTGLFAEDESESLFGGPKKTTSKAELSKPAVKTNQFSSLFGDEADDDSSLFGGPSKSSSPVKPKIEATKKSMSFLFGDDGEDEDLFSSKPAAGKSKASSLFDDDEPLVTKKPESVVTKPVETKPVITSKPVSKASSLFDDDDDEPLVTKKPESLITKPAETKPVNSSKPASKALSLFDDDDDQPLVSKKTEPVITKPIVTNPMSAPKPAANASSLFDDDDDDDDIFKPKPKAVPVPVPVTAAKKTTSSLFDDDDESGSSLLPSSPKQAPESLPSKQTTLPLAESASSSQNVQSSLAATMKAAAAKRNVLEDDDDDNDDDDSSLFGSTVKQVVPSQPESVKVIVPEANLMQAAMAATMKAAAARRNIVDEEDDNSDRESLAPLTKSPPVPITNTESSTFSSDVVAAAQATSIFDEDEVDRGSSLGSRPDYPAIPPPIPPKEVVIKSSIFDSDEEKPAAKPIDSGSSISATMKAGAARRTMFEDDSDGNEDDDSSLFGSSSKPKPVSSLTSASPSIPIKTSETPKIPVPLSNRPDSDEDEDSLRNSESGRESFSSKGLDSEDRASFSVRVSNSSRISGGLASRMAGLDPSKMIMPGAAPPRKVLKAPVEDEAEASKAKVEDSKGTMANLNRASVGKKQRRAPTKKAFTEASGISESPTSEAVSLSPKEQNSNYSSSRSEVLNSSLFGLDDEFEAVRSDKSSKDVLAVPVLVPVKDKDLFDDNSLFPSKAESSVVVSQVEETSPSISDPFSTKSVTSTVSQLPEKPIISNVSSAPLKAASLFDDDNDDGLFGGKSSPKPAATTTNSKAISLFGDDDDGLFGSKTSPKPASTSTKASSLFGDDDDLFGGKPSISTKEMKSNAASRSSLFGDDDEDGLFGSKSNSATKKTAKGLFDD